MATEEKYLKEYVDDVVDPEDIRGIRYRDAQSCYTCRFSTGAGKTMRCINTIVAKGAKKTAMIDFNPTIYVDEKHICNFYKEE